MARTCRRNNLGSTALVEVARNGDIVAIFVVVLVRVLDAAFPTSVASGGGN